MKKGIIFIIVVTALSLLLCGCSNKPAEEETAAVVRVATDPVWPPFEMMDEDSKEITGFDIDLMKAIAEEEGLNVEFVSIAFDSVVAGVAECTYDAAASAITITDDRKEQMLFSDPYFTSGQILTVKEGNEANDTKEAYEGKSIGAQLGTTGAIMAQEWADEGLITYKGYDTVDLAFMDLKNGQIDATLTDDTVAYAYSESMGGIIPVGELFSSEDYGIAVCKNNTDLQTAINSGLAKIKENGKWDELYAKYFSAE